MKSYHRLLMGGASLQVGEGQIFPRLRTAARSAFASAYQPGASRLVSTLRPSGSLGGLSAFLPFGLRTAAHEIPASTACRSALKVAPRDDFLKASLAKPGEAC
jgi:hypothetical protein